MGFCVPSFLGVSASWRFAVKVLGFALGVVRRCKTNVKPECRLCNCNYVLLGEADTLGEVF